MVKFDLLSDSDSSTATEPLFGSAFDRAPPSSSNSPHVKTKQPSLTQSRTRTRLVARPELGVWQSFKVFGYSLGWMMCLAVCVWWFAIQLGVLWLTPVIGNALKVGAAIGISVLSIVLGVGFAGGTVSTAPTVLGSLVSAGGGALAGATSALGAGWCAVAAYRRKKNKLNTTSADTNQQQVQPHLDNAWKLGTTVRYTTDIKDHTLTSASGAKLEATVDQLLKKSKRTLLELLKTTAPASDGSIRQQYTLTIEQQLESKSKDEFKQLDAGQTEPVERH